MNSHPVTTTDHKHPSDAETHSAEAVLRLVNAERKKHGRHPLTAHTHLADMAWHYSRDMAVRGFFDHEDPDGHDPEDRAKKAHISSYAGENIARGQRTPEEVVTAWMHSPGHRFNILRRAHTHLGVGVYFNGSDKGPWWTQDFGF